MHTMVPKLSTSAVKAMPLSDLFLAKFHFWHISSAVILNRRIRNFQRN